MKIVFPLFNHSEFGREAARDLLDPLIFSLRILGVDAATGEPDVNALNIFTECFIRKEAKKIIQANYRFGVICTERFDGKIIAGRSPERSQAFLELAKEAEFLWATIDAEAYRAVNENTAMLRLGFEPGILDSDNQTPSKELSVVGGITESRRMEIETLERRGFKIAVSDGRTPKEQRDKNLKAARFVLGWGAAAREDQCSLTRCMAALHANRPILMTRPLTHMGALNGIPIFTPFSNLSPTWLNGIDWKAERDRQIMRVSMAMPNRVYVADVLSRTLPEFQL